MSALISISLTCFGQTEAELADIDSALNFLGMTRNDFLSDRTWIQDDSFLLPVIRQALESPLAAHQVCRDFSAAVPVKVDDAGDVNRMAKFISCDCPEVVCRDIEAQLAAAQPTALDPFEPMLSAFALADGYRRQAFANLSDGQRQALLLAAPLWFEDEDTSADDTLKGMLHRAFHVAVDTSQNVTSDSVLTLLYLVNREALSAAEFAFARGLALTVQSWRNAKPPFQTAVANGVEGLVLAVRETQFGTFVLGGSGPNTYTGDFALIIDLGGDDRYLSRAGAAVGDLGHPISAVIDLSGNDLYLSSLAANFGCGILGLGAVVDLSGDDIYRSAAFSQGAAFCGCGLLFDGGGDDIYRAGLESQAAAVCGIAVLADAAGRDIYDVTEFGQGFASTFAAAALVDGGGNDVYRAGGTDPHAPLRPEDFRSFAQGFAIGSRPRGGGGIALLHDYGGNDFYDGEIYAQGVGYWYSLGGLIDDGGNDSYNATQYSQGAGIHLAAGVLEDMNGDDRYGSRFGPGQGAAHDLSVGIFLDHSGDDQYIISGGQGMAITNSAALFLDNSGNDVYSTTEGDLGQGGVRDARDFGSLGVFVDGEGHDAYPVSSGSDSSAWIRGLFGVGYDVPRDSVRPREAEVSVTLVPEDTLRSVEDLFRDASRWEVTDNRERVRRARLALVAKGQAAVRWVGANKLDADDALERRATIELFKAYPDSAAPYLYAALDKDNRYSRRNAIIVFDEMKYRPSVRALQSKLNEPSYEILRPTILSAFGDIGDTMTVPTLLQYSSSKVERERIAAMVSLGKLKDPRGFDAIVNGLEDEKYTVRSAAAIAVGRQDANILPVLQNAMSDAESEFLEVDLSALQRLADNWAKQDDTKKGIQKIAPIVRLYLEYPDPRIQAVALRTAASVFDNKELQRTVKRFESTQAPVLQAQVRQLQLMQR